MISQQQFAHPLETQFAKTSGTTEQGNVGNHRWQELNIAVSFNSGYLYFRPNKAFMNTNRKNTFSLYLMFTRRINKTKNLYYLFGVAKQSIPVTPRTLWVRKEGQLRALSIGKPILCTITKAYKLIFQVHGHLWLKVLDLKNTSG